MYQGKYIRKYKSLLTPKSKRSKKACIKEMIGGYGEHNSDNDTDAWLKTINRGGPWHVNEELYLLLELIKEYIRHHLVTVDSYLL